MKPVKPRAVLGLADAKDLGVNRLTGGSLPEPDLKPLEKIANFWRAMPGNALDLIRDEVAEYMVDQQIDAIALTPKELLDLADKLEGAVEGLQTAVQEARSARLLSPFTEADFDDAVEPVLAQLVAQAGSLRARAGTPRRGGGPGVKHARQVELARRLIALFGAHGWPTATSKNSPLGQTLRFCLEAVGEPHADPDHLLKAAAA